MKGIWTGQAVLGHFIVLCDFDLGPSQTVFVHCTLHYGNAHAYQVSSPSAFR